MQSYPLTPGPHPASTTPPLVGPLMSPPPSQYGTPACEAANAAIWSPWVAAEARLAPADNERPARTTNISSAPIVLTGTFVHLELIDRPRWTRGDSMGTSIGTSSRELQPFRRFD